MSEWSRLYNEEEIVKIIVDHLDFVLDLEAEEILEELECEEQSCSLE